MSDDTLRDLLGQLGEIVGALVQDLLELAERVQRLEEAAGGIEDTGEAGPSER